MNINNDAFWAINMDHEHIKYMEAVSLTIKITFPVNYKLSSRSNSEDCGDNSRGSWEQTEMQNEPLWPCNFKSDCKVFNTNISDVQAKCERNG
jgi:hypothetical protein